MSHGIDTIEINALGRSAAHAPKTVLSAIQSASKASGVDFSYLVQQAKAESSFDVNAKAKTSSATGLYQFIDKTWLSMVQNYGKDYGLNTSGMTKQEILDMRHDPKASSFMAAAFASENERFLNTHWGGDIGSTELYFAHFLGASGAASFLNARDDNPLQNAADLFPQAARANRNVFYDRDTGQARTLEQVYAFFDKKFEDAPSAVQTPAPTEKPNVFVESQHNTHTPLPNQLYDVTRSAVPRDAIMERVNTMREQEHFSTQNNGIKNRWFGSPEPLQTNDAPSVFWSASHTRTANTPRQNADSLPFFQLVQQPVDIMMLTQTAKPSKVVRSRS